MALTFGRDTQVITVAIFSEFRQFGSNLELIAPAAFISLVLLGLFFFAFQRYRGGPAGGPSSEAGTVDRLGPSMDRAP